MRAAAILLAGWIAGAGSALAQCPLPAALGQVVLPPEPCFEISASFDEPTTRYRHGILGDDADYAVLAVRRERITVRVRAPITQVFEDIAPRLADIDGKPGPEIVVVESNERGGAALVVYKPDFAGGGRPGVERLAGTPWLGRRHLWLAPSAIADFNGDGRTDIAYVATPHIGGVLRFVTLQGGALVEIAAAEGFSNHRIGDAFISGGVRDCGAGPELVLANADWTRLVAARLVEGEVVSDNLGPLAGPEDFAPALACEAP